MARPTEGGAKPADKVTAEKRKTDPMTLIFLVSSLRVSAAVFQSLQKDRTNAWIPSCLLSSSLVVPKENVVTKREIHLQVDFPRGGTRVEGNFACILRSDV